MKQQRLYLDARPGKQPGATEQAPDSSYPYGKNGIQFDRDKTPFNEPGFLQQVNALLPTGYTHMGTIETDSTPIIMATDETYSYIASLNPLSDVATLTVIVWDKPGSLVNWPAGGSTLDFKKANYITGQSQRNYKGELVITFTDKVEFPKYLNCTTPAILNKDDIRLFPICKPPLIILTESLGGSLTAGTYYVSISYERNDGTATQHSEVSTGITIAPGNTGTNTDKAILINITGADTNYNLVRISVISRINGKTTATELTDPVPVISSTIEILYTGDNLSTATEVSEILTPQALYSKVRCMGQLNDALYLGGLDKEPDINDMQPYANLVTLKWKSELINAVSPPPEHINGVKKSFMHEEVYCFYIRYRKTRGGFTKAYIIPGHAARTGDSSASSEASSSGYTGGAVPKYKVEDTVDGISGFTGNPGTWLNGTEVYPYTDDWNSLSLGGIDLRSTPVRHHKMPSIRWCKTNLYPSNATYGVTHLDLLGITPANITIPAKYTGIIDGYQILYAKRTPANQTVYGQSVLLHGAVDVAGISLPSTATSIYTSGGNWSTSVWHESKGDYNDDWELRELRKDTMRFHAFDMLFNRPSVTPTFISGQLKIKKQHLRAQGYLEDGDDNGAEMPIVHLVDYCGTDVPPTAVPAASGVSLRAVADSFYLTNGISIGQFINSRHENCFAARLLGTAWSMNYGDSGIRIKGQSYTEAAVGSPNYEESYLINMIGLKSDLYTNFYSQRLVSAGDPKDIATLTTIWGGDTFLADYTFHTYGRHDSVDTRGSGVQGIKVIHRFVCESASNIHLRFETPGNEYSKWWPHTPVTANSPQDCYITLFDRSKDPNQFGYTRDLAALNDFISSTVFNPFLEEITHFPYRIHRSGKLSRQARPRNWRTMLPLDYYECQKNMGLIVNLEGYMDSLIIHHENALFRTQDKAKLETNNLSITLGTGDIFQFEPQPGQEAKLGYGGTQHDLACVKTPVGYVFADAKQGEMYILNGKELKSLSPGISTFLRTALPITGTNIYTGNGITIGWDQQYRRILLTVKNIYTVGDAEIDHSFTVSYSVEGGSWTFFHDYKPNIYIHTREKLFNSTNNLFYRHHGGAPGNYYGTVKPFFMDIVFAGSADMLLETVNWMSEYIDGNATEQTWKTLSHISVWNSHQHSGRIATVETLPLTSNNMRRTIGSWSFDDLRNILKRKGFKFISNIYTDFTLDGTETDSTAAWYKKELLTDTWFCVRFEFDNSGGGTLFLHEVNVQAQQSIR